MGRPGLELGAIGKVLCTQMESGMWLASASYRGEGGHVKRFKRSADTKAGAVKRLHEACAEAGASSWMKLPPPPPITRSQMSKPRLPRPEDVPTTLYRFFDRDGDLLYVGISTDPRKRMNDHRVHKSWWSRSTRVELEHYGSWDEARAAEKVAIKVENPVHNVADVLSATDTAIERARERYRTDPDYRRMVSTGIWPPGFKFNDSWPPAGDVARGEPG